MHPQTHFSETPRCPQSTPAQALPSLRGLGRIGLLSVATLLTSALPASANASKDVTYNGTSYNITTVVGKYEDLSALLKQTPWWGSQTPCYALSAAVGQSLGDVLGNTPPQIPEGPIFAFGESVAGHAFSITHDFITLGWFLGVTGKDDTRAYAILYGMSDGGTTGMCLGMGVLGLMGCRRWFASA